MKPNIHKVSHPFRFIKAWRSGDEIAARTDGGLVVRFAPGSPEDRSLAAQGVALSMPDFEHERVMARARRNELLKACDWTQLPDVPQATRELWRVYRHALRTITEQGLDPRTWVWPEPPEGS